MVPFYPDYSTPIKPLSFDLRASKKALQQFFWSWIEEEKQRLGIEKRQGPKGASRNEDKSDRLGDWRHVELLELPNGKVRKGPSRNTQGPHSQRKEKRKEIIATAKRYLVPVVEAWQLASIMPELLFRPAMYCPAFPSLNGREFSREQLVAVIRRVMEKSAKTAG